MPRFFKFLYHPVTRSRGSGYASFKPIIIQYTFRNFNSNNRIMKPFCHYFDCFL